MQTLHSVTAFNRVGPALARLRESRIPAVSKAELARLLRKSGSNIDVIEAEDANPESRTIDRVLDALGCTAHDLARALDEVNGRETRVAVTLSGMVPEADFNALARALARLQREDEARAANESAQGSGGHK